MSETSDAEVQHHFKTQIWITLKIEQGSLFIGEASCAQNEEAVGRPGHLYGRPTGS